MKKILLLLVSTIWLINIYSQNKDTIPDQKFSLKEAQEYALQNNNTIKNARLDVIIAEKKVWETTAIGLPQASINYQYSNNLKVGYASFGPSFDPRLLPENGFLSKQDILNSLTDNPIPLIPKENKQLTFTATQLIFSGEYLVGLQASRVFKMLSAQSLSKTENDTRETVANAYFLILIAQENKTLLDSILINLKSTISDLDKMQQAGFIEETDVDQIRLQTKRIESTLTSLNQQIELSYRLFNLTMGLSDTSHPILTDNLSKLLSELYVPEVVNKPFVLENNVTFQLFNTQSKLTSLSLKREKSKFLPSIAGYYNHIKKYTTTSFDFMPPNTVGIQVKWDLFSSGMRISRVQQAKLEHQKSLNNLSQMSDALKIQYNQAKSDYETNSSKYLNEKESMVLAKRIYDHILFKYKQGVTSSMDIAQAQNQYLTAQSTYLAAILNLLSARVKLENLLTIE